MLVYVCIRTDLILTISAHWPLSGRQIFEDFRALRAQANFDSNFGKSLFTPTQSQRARILYVYLCARLWTDDAFDSRGVNVFFFRNRVHAASGLHCRATRNSGVGQPARRDTRSTRQRVRHTDPQHAPRARARASASARLRPVVCHAQCAFMSRCASPSAR